MKDQRGNAILLLFGCLPGCFVELTAGGYAVMGGNERYARFAPSAGISAGVVYDAYVARVAAGGGGDALLTTVDTQPQAVLSGPGAARLDLATNWNRIRSPNFRVAVGGSFGAGSRMQSNANGTLVAQRYGVYHAYAMPSLLMYLGNPMRSMLSFDVALGPGVFFALNQQGLTDLWAVGGEVRLTFSIPLTQAGIQTLGHMVANTRFNWPTVTEEDVARARAITAQDARERAAAQQRQNDMYNANYNEQYCRANGGTYCGR